MGLEADSYLGPLDKSTPQGTPGFPPCGTLSREPGGAMPDLGPTDI